MNEEMKSVTLVERWYRAHVG